MRPEPVEESKGLPNVPGDNPQQINILNHQVSLFQLDRTKVEIQTWRNALAAAENVFMPFRYNLLKVYRELELDAHMAAIMGKRVRNVTNKDLVWKNAAGEADEAVNKRLNKRWFHVTLKHIMDSIFWGHSLVEFVPGTDGIQKVKLIPRHHVRPEYGLVVVQPTDISGMRYRDPEFAPYNFEVDLGLGLFNVAAANVIFKRGGTIDYANFVELFGSPIRQFKYDSAYEGAKEQAEQIAHDSGNSASIVTPKDSMELELHQGADGNSGNLHGQFLKDLKEELSILVNGQTMTTFSGSSYNQANVHLAEQGEITEDDKKLVMSILNEELIPKLVNLGYPELAGGEFVFDDTEELDMKSKLEIWTKVSEKVPIADDDWYEHFNIPKPMGRPVSSSVAENSSPAIPSDSRGAKKKSSTKPSVTTPKD